MNAVYRGAVIGILLVIAFKQGQIEHRLVSGQIDWDATTYYVSRIRSNLEYHRDEMRILILRGAENRTKTQQRKLDSLRFSHGLLDK